MRNAHDNIAFGQVVDAELLEPGDDFAVLLIDAEIIHSLLDAFAAIRFRLVSKRQFDIGIDTGVHIGGQSVQVSDPAVVR